MKYSRALLIFSYGLFSIAAHSLLFREFLTSFEGNDISVGIFFACWFLWVGAGAIIARKVPRLADRVLQRIELVFVGYIPAFALQFVLTVEARTLAGIESYALFSIQDALWLSILINAPVSLLTGLLFGLLCRWVQKEGGAAVWRVYMLEAAGSFVGGLGATVLLGLKISPTTVFSALAFIVLVSAFLSMLAGAKQTDKAAGHKYGSVTITVVLLIAVCIAVLSVAGADSAVLRYLQVLRWSHLLPAEGFSGAFQTAQAEYLYGSYQGQWLVIRQGSVVEALPDEETAGRVAAICLCQKPDARRVCVIGSGLGVCRAFMRLGQIERVTWADCDNEYVRQLSRYVPPELRIDDGRFETYTGDIRAMLDGRKGRFDIVIVNLPDATNSVLNRYFTLEFYKLARESLSSAGVLAVRTPGGENIMGTELVSIGASTKVTLEQVFSTLVLVPGEDTWFIVSNGGELSGDPGTVRDRFASIAGASDIFPPAGLLSVYLPQRAAGALQSYEGSDLPKRLLVNRDSRPLTAFYSMLLVAKQSEAPVTKFVKHLALAGWGVFWICVLVFVALRFVYVLRLPLRGEPGSFDSSQLVFTAGGTGIGVVIVLMYLYQMGFGSLYLYIGAISSLYMLGLTAGANLCGFVLGGGQKSEEPGIRADVVAIVLIIAQSLLFAVIAFWPGYYRTHSVFAIGFVLCGLCGGCYFPLAARQLAGAGLETGEVGSRLETADHLGAAAGGAATSLLLIPATGTSAALFFFIALLVSNLPSLAVRLCRRGRICVAGKGGFGFRKQGYVLFGVGLAIVVCSNVLFAAGAKLRPVLPEYAARALAGQLPTARVRATLPDSGRAVDYFQVHDANNRPAGYVFSSKQLAGDVRGFGGAMNLAIFVNQAGELVDFHVIQSNETPAYFEMLDEWFARLRGRNLFSSQPFKEIHAVTGATISSEAVLDLLEISAQRFAEHVLGRDTGAAGPVREARPVYVPDSRAVYLIVAVVLTLVVTYRGGFWSRTAVLCFNLLAGGILLNTQYSIEQAVSVLSLQIPSVAVSGAFLLAVAVPLLVAVFGNVYCGYICPFGAAQELLGYLMPRRFKSAPLPEQMRKARFIKYLILFLFIVLFFFSREKTTLAAEPLINAFNFGAWAGNFKSPAAVVILIALAGSVYYTRFWCRYLCPTGAFLSLFNNIAPLRRYLPAKFFGRCEFGLAIDDRTDCIYCDKCRYERVDAGKRVDSSAPFHSLRAVISRRLVLVAVLAAICITGISVGRFKEVVSFGPTTTAAMAASGGVPRDVDLQRVKKMIKEKKLSDKEADYYKRTE